MARPLSIAIIASNPPRRWHLRLAAALRRAGHAVRFEVDASRGTRLKGLELLLQLESFAYGARSSAFEASEAGADAAVTDRAADLVIDLRDAPVLNDTQTALAPLFDGAAGESALVSALLDKRAPEITIAHAGAALRVVAHGLAAVERPGVISLALDQVLARVVDLLTQSVARIARGEEMKGGRAVIGDSKNAQPLLFAAQGLAAKITQRLTQLVVHPEHWRIAFRALAGDPTIARGEWPDASWTILPDDRRRFFADPFPFLENGRTYIFCEEYPYATRKAIISVFEIVDGKPTRPRAVLERPYHLSYPFVFRRGANIYMIPETSSVGRIELYRAESFPDRWTFERVLVHDVIASDATLVPWQGRDWLFASLAGDGASTWDALGLFYADDLFGEWTPHPLNPVLIDARSARPGGAMVEMNGRLRRVAQDCHAMYGGGIALTDVERLDPEDYSQIVRAVLAAPSGSRAAGVHTLNTAAEYEFIDLVGATRR